MKLTLTIRDLAEILHVQPRTLENRVHARPESVPPPIIIDGQGTLLWLPETVENWLKSKERVL